MFRSCFRYLNHLVWFFYFMGVGVLAASEGQTTSKTFEVPEIVVTATRSEKELELAPASVSLITKKEIEVKSPKTIDQILNDVPGVMVRRGKGLMDTLSFITLRGVPEQKRTLLLMDGIVLNDPYFGGAKLGGYYPEDLEKVEVVKGPFSSLYGGYAMGGVVNFVTRMPEKREMSLKTGYGSSFDRSEAMDDLKRLYLSYGDKIKDLSLLVSYGRQDTNGYPTDLVTSNRVPTGTAGALPSYDRFGNPTFILGDKGDNTWWDDAITAKVQYELNKDTRVRFNFMRNRYEYNYDEPHPYLFAQATGSPVYYPRQASYLPGAGGRTQNNYGAVFETQVFEKLQTKLNLSYNDTDEDWYVTVGTRATTDGCPPGTRPADCGYVSTTPKKAFTTDLTFNMPLFSNHILTMGVYFRTEKSDTKENYLTNWKDENSQVDFKYESKGKTRNYAFYIQDEVILNPNLSLYLGAREDFWKAYDGYVNQAGAAGYPKEYESHSESCLSPKFAIVFKPQEKTVLRGSVGRAFRPPTIYDLYRTWTSSTGITYAGNPNLSPETLWSYEAGISQGLWKNAKFTLTGFLNKMDDLIYRRTVSATYQEYINVGKAESRGFEAELEQKFDIGLRLFGNLTYTHSEIRENNIAPETKGKRLTHVPLCMWNLGAEYKIDNFSAYVVGRYMDKWYSDDNNRDNVTGVYGSYDDYFVVDAKFSYNLTKFSTISLSFDNIFNKDYYYYYKAPGRSWFLELSIKF